MDFCANAQLSCNILPTTLPGPISCFWFIRPFVPKSMMSTWIPVRNLCSLRIRLKSPAERANWKIVFYLAPLSRESVQVLFLISIFLLSCTTSLPNSITTQVDLFCPTSNSAAHFLCRWPNKPKNLMVSSPTKQTQRYKYGLFPLMNHWNHKISRLA